MSMIIWGVCLVVLASMVEGFAQVCLKLSVGRTQPRARWIAIGLAAFAIEAILYSGGLQSLDISTAYPLSALSFASVTLFSKWMLGECIDIKRVVGLVFIVGGAALVLM